ncbi:hypothetical protein S83_062822, partial [Arachis hypogaea]
NKASLSSTTAAPLSLLLSPQFWLAYLLSATAIISSSQCRDYLRASPSFVAAKIGSTVSRGSTSLFPPVRTKLFFLVERCFQLREPVLLVGETGGGKTINDVFQGFRPLRERSRLISNYKEIVEQLKKLEGFRYFPEEPLVSSNIEQAASTLDMLNGYKEGQIQIPDVSRDDLCAFEQLKFELDVLHKKWQSIFEWHDGPLVKTMRRGDLFLVDEISLTDDSVLKRLNSVLEPERTL